MILEPVIVQRSPRPYAYIRNIIPMGSLGTQLPPEIGEVFAWLATHGIAPAGPPFWKYNIIDPEGLLDVEVGVPTMIAFTGDGRVSCGTLPGGSYAVAHHVGHPDTLGEATREFLEWAEENGVHWSVTATQPQRWDARLEEYPTNPAAQPDMNQWETNLAFKIADE